LHLSLRGVGRVPFQLIVFVVQILIVVFIYDESVAATALGLLGQAIVGATA